jgi:hypothetical protein
VKADAEKWWPIIKDSEIKAWRGRIMSIRPPSTRCAALGWGGE